MYLQHLYQIDSYNREYSSYNHNSFTQSKRFNSNSLTKTSLSSSSQSIKHKTPMAINHCRTQYTNNSDIIYYQFTKEFIQNKLQSSLYDLCNSLNFTQIKLMLSYQSLHKERMPKINWKYEEGNTLLHIFSSKGNYTMIDFLLGITNDININAINDKGRTALHLAILNNHLNIVDLLLSVNDVNVNCQDEELYTPLMYATIKGNNHIVEYLLIKRADIGLKNRYGQFGCDLMKGKEMRMIYQKYVGEDRIKENSTIYMKEFGKDLVKSNYSRRDIINKLQYKNRKMLDLMRHSSLFKYKLIIDNNSGNSTQEENNYDCHCFPKVILIGKNMGINGLIGRGGFAEIYSVYFKNITTTTNTINNHDNQYNYALKVMKKSKILAFPSKKASILMERSILSKLHNPFIAEFYRAYQNSTHLMLLIELLPHGDLKSYIRAHPNSLNEEDIKIISSQLILAIEHLHKQNIVYRDLKPENILIDKEGFIKLIDFGLSKENVISDTACKSFCGSLAYLSPDVIKQKGYGRGIDWYMLGVVIYEMLYGYPPYFTLEGKDALLDNIQYGELQFNPKKIVSEELMNLMIMLLDRKINKRLCAGLSDADEIKMHSFYKGINFNHVIYNKHFIPTKKLTDNILKIISDYDKSFIDCDYSDMNYKDSNYLKGWDI